MGVLKLSFIVEEDCGIGELGGSSALRRHIASVHDLGECERLLLSFQPFRSLAVRRDYELDAEVRILRIRHASQNSPRVSPTPNTSAP